MAVVAVVYVMIWNNLFRHEMSGSLPMSVTPLTYFPPKSPRQLARAVFSVPPPSANIQLSSPDCILAPGLEPALGEQQCLGWIVDSCIDLSTFSTLSSTQFCSVQTPQTWPHCPACSLCSREPRRYNPGNYIRNLHIVIATNPDFLNNFFYSVQPFYH